MTLGVLFLLFLLFSRKPKVVVETANVVRETIVESVSASGEIDADQKADLTFQEGGRLIWVGVKEGDEVRRGQALAKLDTTVLNSAYQSARATLRAAEATVDNVHDQVKDHSGDETSRSR